MAKHQSKHFTVTLFYPDNAQVIDLDVMLMRGLRDHKNRRPEYINIHCNNYHPDYVLTEQTIQAIHHLEAVLQGGSTSRGRIRLIPYGFHKQVYTKGN